MLRYKTTDDTNNMVTSVYEENWTLFEPDRINIGSDHANMNILLNSKSIYFKGFLYIFQL